MQNTRQTQAAVPRLDGIDTLRGLAILGVILLHTWIRFAGEGLKLARTWPPLWRHFVWFNGGNGVTVFFAVSGFLITLTSLRRFGALGALRPAVFYRIRFARIMPLLLLLLGVLSVLHLCGVRDFVVSAKHFTLTRALVSALLFHLNWLEASRDAWLPACWTVLWSLSIEEMFYLFFPLVSVALFSRVLDRRSIGRVLWIALAVAFITMGPFARTVWSHTDLQQENSYLAGMSNIAFGCLTALLVNYPVQKGWWKNTTAQHRVMKSAQCVGWFLIVLFAFWPYWPSIRPVMHFIGKTGTDDTLLALGTCLVMSSVYLRGIHGRAWCAPVRWFGRHSYELYLWHEFVVIACIDLYVRLYPHKDSSRLVIVLFVVAIFAMTAPLAWAMAKWFSEPLNRKLRGAPLPTEKLA